MTVLRKLQLLIAVGICLLSTPASAADNLHWKSWLAGVMLISLAIGGYKSYHSEKANSVMAKLLLTGLYFWVFTFAQLIVLAVVYHFTR